MTRLHHLILFLVPSVLGGLVPKTCKAYPGSSDWPSHKAWSRLNDTLDGRLFAPVPPGAVCHKGWPSYDKDTCPEVAEAWKHYDLHTQDPVSLIYDQYSNWTCLPDESYPCSGTGYPAYVINVTEAEDIKIGVDFGKYFMIQQELLLTNGSSEKQRQTRCQEHRPRLHGPFHSSRFSLPLDPPSQKHNLP
jgi:hypothetical protein